ncbi:TKL protein kinase [Fonticula alba]|uniref:TKL protein kinase n=1 Tax=Fonticula alba TaxID=691883 RepID=A0A058Z0R6_FONAL|nr:TKL protein kinase [Fonticula alba]KCV67483.1 TKL protein kinase [Fonticula alba]|eukprot:XP_009498044.1 TKL protein kinase [Fonticula alba]
MAWSPRALLLLLLLAACWLALPAKPATGLPTPAQSPTHPPGLLLRSSSGPGLTVACHESCLDCSGPAIDQCTRCAKILLNGRCIDACPPTHYEANEGSLCLACPTFCADIGCNPFGRHPTPDYDGPCGRCLSEPTLHPTCLPPHDRCPHGQYAPATGPCAPCHPHCAACTGPKSTDCTLCQSGTIRLPSGACAFPCPEGLSTFAHSPNGACEPCHHTCTRCTGPSANQCTACLPGLLLDQATGQCLPPAACPPGTYRHSTNPTVCRSCHASCGECRGPSADQCTLCTDDKTLLAGRCHDGCPPGHFCYLPELLDQRLARACHPSCATCSGTEPDQCTSCPTGQPPVQDQCKHHCPAGLFPTPDAQPGACTPCHPSCDTCSGPAANHCTTCPGGIPLQEGTCVNVCGSGFYLSDDFAAVPICQPCHPKCRECTSGTGDTCTACPDGWLLEAGHCVTACSPTFYPRLLGNGRDSCQECHAPCQECRAPGQCTACREGFWPDTEDPGAGPDPHVFRCQPCQTDSTCRQCDRLRPDVCLKCQDGLFLHNGSCPVGCPAGMYESLADGRCLPCSAGCAQCSSADQCTGCLDGPFFLDDGVCRLCNASCLKCSTADECLECAPGFVWPSFELQRAALCTDACPVGSFRQTDWCQPCHATCAECADAAHICTACSQGHRFSGPGVCSACPASGARPCALCPPGGGGACLQCAPGGLLTPDGRCEDQCPTGTYAQVDASAAGQCRACAPECATCHGPGSDACLTCSPGLAWVADPGHPQPGSGTCEDPRCPAGQYHAQDPGNPAVDVCLPCDPACAVCGGPLDSQCWMCADSARFIEHGLCQAECSPGFVPVAGRCLPCHESCATCTGTRFTDCQACPSDLLLFPTPGGGQQCLASCPAGFMVAGGACVPCQAGGCVRCPAAPQVCTHCERHLFLHASSSGGQDTCLPACPPGSVAVGAQCLPCWPGCASCSGPGSQQCLSCQPGQGLVLHQWQCLAACPSGTFAPAGQAVCLPCHATCARCTDGSGVGCSACPAGAILWQGRCLGQCPISTFPQPAAASCQQCHSDCLDCAGAPADQCTACPLGLSRQAPTGPTACLADCPEGQAACPATGMCVPCPAGCQQCLVPDFDGTCAGPVCLACAPGHFRTTDGRCVAGACPAGEFPLADGVTCAWCHAPCARCHGSADFCTACARGTDWLLPQEGRCLPSGCPGAGFARAPGPGSPPERLCLACTVADCDTCQEALDAAGPAPGGAPLPDICPHAGAPLPAGPRQCPPIGRCNRCMAGLFLLPVDQHTDACVAACPAGHYEVHGPSAWHCAPCAPGCSSCDGPLPEHCTRPHGVSPRAALGMGLGIGLLLLVLLGVLGLALVYFLRGRRRHYKTMPNEFELDDQDATVLNTAMELSLPGAALVSLEDDFLPEAGGTLGAGTQASVFSARVVGPGLCERLKCPDRVAIKRFKEEDMRVRSKQFLFQHEIALLWLLRGQPNVIQMYGYSDSPPTIILELFDTPLDDLLASEVPLSLGETLGIAQGFARGLTAMHEARIAHCDIKPANVLVRRVAGACWYAAIADLGGSKSVSPDRQNALTVAPVRLNALSAAFASPECLQALFARKALAPELSLASDIYSSAILLWGLFSRIPPGRVYRGLGIEDLATKVLAGGRPPVEEALARWPASVACPLETLLQDTWQEDFERRPTAPQLQARLAELAAAAAAPAPSDAGTPV